VTGRLSDFANAVRLLRGAFLLDHSVSVGELGSLFQRDGDSPLQQLKRNIANAYGVAWSFPAACGTSPLNVLGLLALAPPGSVVAVNRDCHVSVHAALVHGGYRPVYYCPEFDSRLGLPLGPTAQAVEALLSSNPDVRCVVVTYPSYFGIAGDCAGIVEAAHRRGIPVLVDAAHGAPLHFCSALPVAAEDVGADIVLQSTHKTMGALSQGSIALFASETYLDAFYDAVSHLGLVSTSFSYPTLSSIELAIARHEIDGEESWNLAIAEADRFRERVSDIDGVTTFGAEAAGRSGFVDMDRTRVTLDVSATGLSGFDFERLLREEQIYPEMATSRHVLFLFTPGTRPEDTSYLVAAIERLTENADVRHAVRSQPWNYPAPAVPELAIVPRDAYFAKKRTVAIEDSIGSICGETIAPYPPGSAVIAAGERLDAGIVDYLRRVQIAGGVLYGASDPQFRRIKVVA